MKKPKKKVELFKHNGCKDCQRNCLYNSLVAVKDVAERGRNKFPCNSKIDFIEIKKDMQKLIGGK